MIVCLFRLNQTEPNQIELFCKGHFLGHLIKTLNYDWLISKISFYSRKKKLFCFQIKISIANHSKIYLVFTIFNKIIFLLKEYKLCNPHYDIK